MVLIAISGTTFLRGALCAFAELAVVKLWVNKANKCSIEPYQVPFENKHPNTD